MQKKEILTERYNILKTVSNYVNEDLNPSKRNFYDVQREDILSQNQLKKSLTC